MNKLKTANNVIPFKSNVFDCIVKHIDSFSCFTHHKYETPLEIYKSDKKFLWDYLDHQLNYPIEISKFLTKNNIPFRYFDLDNDSYIEVFGGDFEIDKEYTSHVTTWKEYEDRYNQVARMADEYISLRNLSLTYTPT